MPHIVPAIALEQHLQTLICQPESYRPVCCPSCGLKGLWAHGCYERKADRDRGDLNPVVIPRYLCGRRAGCGTSCSSLPSALSPRRWYEWRVQQAVLVSVLSGASLRSCARQLAPALSTVRRWWGWLTARHEDFAFHLRAQWPEWGRVQPWQIFWQHALQQQPLAELMAYLNQQGRAVP